MAKARSKRPSYLRRFLYLLATVLTGSGAGGWAFPDLPVLGPAVKSVVEKFLASHGVELPTGLSSPEIASAGPGSSADQGSVIGAVGTVPLVTASHQGGQQAASPVRDVISIGSFNIQVFGTSKLQKQGIPEILATVARSFDLLAIQEIRTQDDHFLDQFLQLVNAQGAKYAYLIGPRLGRSNSKEQYAFLYDTSRIEVRTSSATTLGDANDLLHREPFIAHFRARGVPPAEAFSFWLINVHTDPDEVGTELDVLAEAFQVVQQQGEDV